MGNINFKLLVLTVFMNPLCLLGQDMECGSFVTTENVAQYLPHFGNNDILNQVLDITMPQRGNIDKNAKTDITYNPDNIPFHIPVKINIYHDDGGMGFNDAIDEQTALQLLDEVNTRFLQLNTGIQFYLKCEVEHHFSTKYNTIDSDIELAAIYLFNGNEQALEWVFVDNQTYSTWNAKATFPWSISPFQLVIATDRIFPANEMILTLMHEVGHTLGLVHTHENIRFGGPFSEWISNTFNGDAGNCYQEAADHGRDQGLACVSTIGDTKCEINGDALCDTPAAPNSENNTHMAVDNAQDCNYTGGGEDNWDDPWHNPPHWTPPTRNYMSSMTLRACRSEFTQGQVGVMHSFIISDMVKSVNGNLVPWFNKNAVYLDGNVNNGESEVIHVAETIVAANSGVYNLNSGSQVETQAQESIMLLPGFHAKNGSVFSAKVDTFQTCNYNFDFTGGSGNNARTSGPVTAGLDYNALTEAYSLVTNALISNHEKYNFDLLKEDDTDNIMMAYPNPAKQSVNFLIRSPSNSVVRFYISDISGNLIEEIITDGKITEFQEIQFDTSKLNDGIYFYTLETRSSKLTKKLIIMD